MGLELRSYGFGTRQKVVRQQPVPKADGQRLSYQWDEVIQEWFVNDQRSLEHGFMLEQRPHGAAPGMALEVVLGTRGTLTASVAADAQAVYFRDEAGAPVVNYAGLKVWDADGQVLSSRFVVSSKGGIALRVEESGARYPITIDPIAQQAYLKPAAVGSSQAGDTFGVSVSVSGDTVVVGAYAEDSGTTGVNSTPDEGAVTAGAAFVFVREAGAWRQQAYLKPAAVGTTQAGDQFGGAVAVSGNTLVVGAIGEDSLTTGINSTPNEGATDSGAAYVFVRSAGIWNQQAYLKPAAVGTTQAGDQFGGSLSLNGDTLVIESPSEDSSSTGINSTPNEGSSGAGAVFIFTGLGPIPTISNIFPASGSSSGGAMVTINGTAFTGATGVTFGNNAATSVSVVNSTTITCAAPSE